MIWLPTVSEIVRAHSCLIEATGGTDGVRDIGLIESALMRASAGFGDQEFYPTVTEKAAAICCGLIGNHGFLDGNKRIGVLTLLLILRKNGVRLSYTQEALTHLGMEAAQGLLTAADILRWIERHAE